METLKEEIVGFFSHLLRKCCGTQYIKHGLEGLQ